LKGNKGREFLFFRSFLCLHCTHPPLSLQREKRILALWRGFGEDGKRYKADQTSEVGVPVNLGSSLIRFVLLARLSIQNDFGDEKEINEADAVLRPWKGHAFHRIYADRREPPVGRKQRSRESLFLTIEPPVLRYIKGVLKHR
jgi:hypothetical protein